MVEILKQPQFRPMNVIDQVMIIFAASKGYLDKVPLRQVSAWEEQFLRFMREQRPEVRNALIKERTLFEKDGKTPNKVQRDVLQAIEFFQPQFKA